MKRLFIPFVALLLVYGCDSDLSDIEDQEQLQDQEQEQEESKYYIEITPIEGDFDASYHATTLEVTTNLDPSTLGVYIVSSTDDNSWINCERESSTANDEQGYDVIYSLTIEAQDELTFVARNAAIQIYYYYDDIAAGDSISIMQSASEISDNTAIITGATNGNMATQIAEMQEEGTLDEDLTIYDKVLVAGNSLNASDLTALKQFTQASYLDISNTTTSTISAKTYQNDTVLEQIILPSTIIALKNNAFNASALVTITIPRLVSDWGTDYNAFYNCAKLESVCLSDGLETFAAALFEGCSALKSITSLSNTPPEIISHSTDSSGNPIYNPICAAGNSDIIIYVPASAVEAYQAAAGWSECNISTL